MTALNIWNSFPDIEREKMHTVCRQDPANAYQNLCSYLKAKGYEDNYITEEHQTLYVVLYNCANGIIIQG